MRDFGAVGRGVCRGKGRGNHVSRGRKCTDNRLKVQPGGERVLTWRIFCFCALCERILRGMCRRVVGCLPRAWRNIPPRWCGRRGVGRCVRLCVCVRPAAPARRRRMGGCLFFAARRGVCVICQTVNADSGVRPHSGVGMASSRGVSADLSHGFLFPSHGLADPSHGFSAARPVSCGKWAPICAI